MAKCAVEYTPEEVMEQLREVIREEMTESVRVLMHERVRDLVDAAIKEQLGPLVIGALNSETFTLRYGSGLYGGTTGQAIDGIVKRQVIEYLDERVYHYTSRSETASERVHRSTSQNSGPTRLECFLRFAIERFVDQHAVDKMTPIAAEFIKERGGIEAVAKQQMAELLRAKFGL